MPKYVLPLKIILLLEKSRLTILLFINVIHSLALASSKELEVSQISQRGQQAFTSFLNSFLSSDNLISYFHLIMTSKRSESANSYGKFS